MGDALTDKMLAAFINEMEEIKKEAGFKEVAKAGLGFVAKRLSPKTIPGLVSRVRNIPGSSAAEEAGLLVQRLKHPVEGMREGWRSMSPAYRAELGAAKAINPAGLEAARASGKSAIQAVQSRAKGLKGRIGPLTSEEAQLMETSKDLAGKGMFGRYGQHMLDPNVGLRQAWGQGGVRGVAEQLSRSGVTGAQGWSKYIPMGEKAMVPGFAATAIPGIVNAPAAAPTGEGAGLEQGLETFGQGAGWVLGAGLGAPGMAAMFGVPYITKRIGRILDRTRAGANMEQALTAPSPEEAQAQLTRIQRHYG